LPGIPSLRRGCKAIERSSRVRTGIFDLTSILPPRCIKNVRSEILMTCVSGNASTVSTILRPCSESLALTVISRMLLSSRIRTISTAPTMPPASPTAVRIAPSVPPRCGNSTLKVML
jgi:hypothetical protein